MTVVIFRDVKLTVVNLILIGFNFSSPTRIEVNVQSNGQSSGWYNTDVT